MAVTVVVVVVVVVVVTVVMIVAVAVIVFVVVVSVACNSLLELDELVSIERLDVVDLLLDPHVVLRRACNGLL